MDQAKPLFHSEEEVKRVLLSIIGLARRQDGEFGLRILNAESGAVLEVQIPAGEIAPPAGIRTGGWVGNSGFGYSVEIFTRDLKATDSSSSE